MILGQFEGSSSGEPAATSGIVADPTPAPETIRTRGYPDSGYWLGLWGYWSQCIQGRNKKWGF